MVMDLSPERALIFRITHIRNVPWILRHGLHCRASAVVDPDFVQIGDRKLIRKRVERVVSIPPGGTLADYVPFYFTPSSPMLYKILTGDGDIEQMPSSSIVVLVASLRNICEAGIPAIFTDQHAYPEIAGYYAELNSLDRIDWNLLRNRDFARDPEDPNKTERYQAEALIHRHLPVEQILAIACARENEKRTLEEYGRAAGMEIKIALRPRWFFGR